MMNLAKLFERKRPHIRATLNSGGCPYIVPLNHIQAVIDEARALDANDDYLDVSIVMMRPSDVAALPEFDGF